MKNSIYLIVSNDKVVVDLKIKEIIGTTKASIIRYDLEEVPIEHLIEDLDTYNLFEDKKIIIGSNATFLTNGKKDPIQHNLVILEKYMENPSTNNVLILVTDSLDKRKKIVTEVIKNSKVIEGDYSTSNLISDNIEDYKMDNSARNLLNEYCPNKETLLHELEKLKLYKLAEKEITCDDIRNIVTKNVDADIFAMIDYIMNGKKKEAFKVYNELLLHGKQVATMITRLGNKIRLIYQVKVFLQSGKSDIDISKILGMHPYPIKLAREASYKYSENQLLDYLEMLARMDYNLKSGESDPSIIFETFIAEL